MQCSVNVYKLKFFAKITLLQHHSNRFINSQSQYYSWNYNCNFALYLQKREKYQEISEWRLLIHYVLSHLVVLKELICLNRYIYVINDAKLRIDTKSMIFLILALIVQMFLAHNNTFWYKEYFHLIIELMHVR